MTTYHCQCHVCGRRFRHEAHFMGGGTSVVGEDGIERSFVTCNVEPSLPRHTRDEIRESWHRRQAIPRVPGNGMAV